MTRTLISFSEVRELLMREGGLRWREAEGLMARGEPVPVKHALHSRRRWLRQGVLDYCAELKKGAAPLGKGACDANSNS
jgi:hypothetical protein